MRYLKHVILGVLALTAFLAVGGTASADVLCKAAPNKAGECETASGDYASGSTFTAEATNASIAVTGSPVVTSVTCERSNISLKTTSTGGTQGTAVNWQVTDLTWTGNCHTNSGVGCVVSTVSGNTGRIVATDNKGDANFEINSGITVSISCTPVFSCVYEGLGADLGFVGGNPALLVVSNEFIPLLTSGIGCGSGALPGLDWSGTYTMTGTNKAVWIATKNA